LKALALLWIAGACLRLTLLAVPPVIPQIHAAFSLSQAAIGALTSLPVLLFSFAAIPGSLLIARMGPARVLTLGLFVTAIGGALRGISVDAVTLFASTFAMGVGIAIMQPALPSVVRDWTPQRVALGIATYSNGLLVGEAISASLTIPFVLPLVNGNWRASLAAWSLPVLVAAVMSMRPPASHAAHPGATGGSRRWWPDWHDPLTWGTGLLAGYASSLYYATNAFLPGFLEARGRPELLNATLSALNWMQLPASFLMLAYGRRLTMRRAPFVGLNALSLTAIVGLVLGPASATVAWSGVIGFCNAFLLILTLAMPPLMARPEDVPRLSAAMFLIGYLCAFVVPIIGGAAWDATHAPAAAFVPLLVFGLLTLGVATRLDLARSASR
jgi:CP family cyanate transporter-like MFS transporter